MRDWIFAIAFAASVVVFVLLGAYVVIGKGTQRETLQQRLDDMEARIEALEAVMERLGLVVDG